jgi:hypothetical protein
MMQLLARSISGQFDATSRAQALSDHMLTLEAMIEGGWVVGRIDKRLAPMPRTDKGGRSLRATEEGLRALGARKSGSG